MLLRAGLIWLLAASLALAGCAPSPGVKPLPSPEELMDPAQPAIMGATNGLEMRVWVTQDQDDVLADAIKRYEALPTPMLDSVRQAWRASGFRVIALPTDELPALPDWSEAVRGRAINAGTAIEPADGVMKSPAGRLRMLMRCWTAPGEVVTDPAMHLELAVQLERRAAVGSPFELPAMQSELEAGVVFPRLRATMRVPSDTALVIVPMAEHTTASVAAEAEPEPGLAPEPIAEGPPVPLTPTLGEAMLTSAVPGAIEPVRRRAVVVLLPRLPERFRLSAADATASAPLRR